MAIKHIYATYDWKSIPLSSGDYKFCPYCATALTIQEIDERPRPTCPQCNYVQFKNPAPAISVLVADGDQVLLLQRQAQLGYGKWALPSGYIEYGEDFLSTAQREVKEETGLDVEILAILNVESAFLSPRLHFFTAYLLAHPIHSTESPPVPTPNQESMAIGWFPICGPLPDMAFEPDRALISAYAQGNLPSLPL